jgi:hypothetical protein
MPDMTPPLPDPLPEVAPDVLPEASPKVSPEGVPCLPWSMTSCPGTDTPIFASMLDATL